MKRPMFRKKRPVTAERVTLDSAHLHDRYRRQVKAPNGLQPVGFSAAMSLPTTLEQLIERVRADVDAIAARGGLDAANAYKDGWILAHLPMFRALRYQESKEITRTAEELRSQTVHNLAIAEERYLNHAVEVEALQSSIDAAVAILSGVPAKVADPIDLRYRLIDRIRPSDLPDLPRPEGIGIPGAGVTTDTHAADAEDSNVLVLPTHETAPHHTSTNRKESR